MNNRFLKIDKIMSFFHQKNILKKEDQVSFSFLE